MRERYSVSKDRIVNLCRMYSVLYNQKTYANMRLFLETYVDVKQMMEYIPKNLQTEDLWAGAPQIYKAMTSKKALNKTQVIDFLTLMVRSGELDTLINNSLDMVNDFDDEGPIYHKILMMGYFGEEHLKNKEIEIKIGYSHGTYQQKKERAVMLFGVLFWKQMLEHWENSEEEMEQMEREFGKY